jgi:hypothetical protein
MNKTDIATAVLMKAFIDFTESGHEALKAQGREDSDAYFTAMRHAFDCVLTAFVGDILVHTLDAPDAPCACARLREMLHTAIEQTVNEEMLQQLLDGVGDLKRNVAGETS